MNISYDKNNRVYILGEKSYTKEDFIKYIEAEMLQSALSKESVNIDIDDKNTDEMVDYDLIDRKENGDNILLYGVPGSGKSWIIENEYCSEDTTMQRIVFHPDYSNSEFIGQILPVIDDEKQVYYKFIPGPFTQILKQAYYNPNKEFVLVIEEINRGNAPAIFGEVFQLLDRVKKEDETPTKKAGFSEYGIYHSNMAEYIYKNANHEIKMPSNLSLMGTMNTSDQNIFTLDTAFQRRWGMRLVENNFDNVKESLARAEILDTGITWEKFCETMNEIIVSNRNRMASSEDKRLGVYFISESALEFNPDGASKKSGQSLLNEYNELLLSKRKGNITNQESQRLKDIQKATIHNRKFPEKVIKYLWDDVFKFNRDIVFNNCNSLEDVIRKFVFENEGVNRFDIFNQSVLESLTN